MTQCAVLILFCCYSKKNMHLSECLPLGQSWAEDSFLFTFPFVFSFLFLERLRCFFAFRCRKRSSFSRIVGETHAQNLAKMEREKISRWLCSVFFSFKFPQNTLLGFLSTFFGFLRSWLLFITSQTRRDGMTGRVAYTFFSFSNLLRAKARGGKA